MIIIQCILFALLDSFVTLVAFLLVNWWAPLFVGADGHLQGWLKWFDTFDDPLAPGQLPTYWNRMCWLYRNPAYGFSYWALGVPFDSREWIVHWCTYDELAGETLDFYATGPRGAFYRLVIWHGIRIKIGWKVLNLYYAKEQHWRERPWGPEWRIPFVFSISKA